MICDVCGRVCSVIKMEMTRIPSVKRTYKCNNCGLGFDTIECKSEDIIHIKKEMTSNERNA